MGAANAARHAAGRIFRLADDELLIDPLGDGGARGPSKGCALDFSSVKFAYPQRPDAQVNGISAVGDGGGGGVGGGGGAGGVGSVVVVVGGDDGGWCW